MRRTCRADRVMSSVSAGHGPVTQPSCHCEFLPGSVAIPMLYLLLAAAFLVLAVALRLLAEDGPRNDEDEPPDSADGESGPDLLLAA